MKQSLNRNLRKFSIDFAALILTLVVSAMPVVHAAVPQTMSYQGILKDNSGNYLTGTYSITFKLYNALSGGSALWTETQGTVSVSSGKFSVILGSGTPINLNFDADYWLGITVGADAEMSPRVKLTSLGYAYMAQNLVNAFTQTAHDALSHKNIEGVKDNTVNIAKTNFKLDAYSVATANSMGELVVDSFNDANGIASGSSSNYTWRGSSNFDVTVTPGGIDAYAVLALHGNGSDGSTTFTDSSSGAKTVTANGNAQIDTAQSKFGGAAGLFDGAGDYLSVADSADWDFGTGDFTIDFWFRLVSHSGNISFVEVGDGASAGIEVLWNNSGELDARINGTFYSGGTFNPADGTWYHVAVTRSGTSLRIFINGTQSGSTQSSSENILVSSALKVGSRQGSSLYLNGWLEELRVSKGIARWTANFTVPSSEYASSGGTGTVVSNVYTQAVAPSEVIVIADETLGTGSIAYYVSRNNGTNWTQCTKEAVTDISAQPSGTQLRWKAVISGDAELNAIALAV